MRAFFYCSVRHIEEEFLIPIQEEINEGSLLILSLKKKKPDPLFNLRLLRYVVFVTAMLWGFGLFLSSRASYLYSVSRATEDLQKEMVVLSNQNDMLRIEVEEVTSMETITERALEMGFGLPQEHQIYEMPKLAERSIN